jgi:hypothetical protein
VSFLGKVSQQCDPSPVRSDCSHTGGTSTNNGGIMVKASEGICHQGRAGPATKPRQQPATGGQGGGSNTVRARSSSTGKWVAGQPVQMYNGVLQGVKCREGLGKGFTKAGTTEDGSYDIVMLLHSEEQFMAELCNSVIRRCKSGQLWGGQGVTAPAIIHTKLMVPYSAQTGCEYLLHTITTACTLRI